MQSYISILRRYSFVRASAVAIFIFGFAGAATSPFQPVIGVRELGLSNHAYALIAVFASITNAIAAVGIGLLSDRFQSYHRPLVLSSGIGILGFAAIWAMPSQPVFTMAVIGPLALFSATNSLLFGNLRAQSEYLKPDEIPIANALMRMMISLSWVVVPGLVGLALSSRDSVIDAYLISAVMAAACLATVLFWLRPDRSPKSEPLPPAGGTGTAPVAPSAGRADRPAQVRLVQPGLRDLGRLLVPGTALRILGVALISQVLTVNGTVLPLILTGQANGRAADMGLVVGMVAVLEVIFMILWVRAMRRMTVTTALAISAGLYLIYLGGLAMTTAPWQVYAVSLVAGVGAAGIISLPITYLLDLIRDLPGLSASLIAVNMFLGAAFGSACFALGTAIAGYQGAAVLGGLAGVAGAGLLIILEREE
ncbi:MFS transporter [Paracoccus sp. (in: a-proteobacteria)]|uniref:MFS transporter n=1 Tax=Paracoccus sp. TaxID=267 RepID=UPI003A86DFCD